ncbi:MAG TPA: hypothetical protein VD866_31295 [Urbifossiella sp.]|nr:hypothetical protein [Urbifossiella sp.]
MPTRLLPAAALLVVVIGCGKKPAPEQAAADPEPQPPPRRVNTPQDDERDSTPFPRPAGDRDSTPFPQPGQKKDASPFPQPGGKAKPAPSWTDDPAPGDKKAPAGRGANPGIVLKGTEVVAFGPPGCPVVLVGQELYDLKTFEPAGRLPLRPDQNSRPVLTHDGKLVAFTEKGKNVPDTPVYVCATDTGKMLLTVPAAKGVYPDVMAFYANTHLIVGGRHAGVMDVWDLATGKKAGGLTSPHRQVRHGDLAFTPDGTHFAAIAGDKLVVVGTKTGKQKVLAAPAGGGPLGPRGVFSSAKGLVFSPDGSELALFTTNPNPRLIVWSPQGQIVLDAPVPMPRWVGLDAALQWLPDSSGWLVNGSVFDRGTKRVVASVRVGLGSAAPYLVDQSRVVGAFGWPGHRLRAADIPWPQIRESLAAMGAKADADLAPGRPVALDLRLTGVRGDEAETRNILGQALALRLGRDGIPVAAQAPTVLRLKLAESAGDTLPIYARQSRFDFKGADTGQRATEVNGAAVLELWAAGEATPVWRDTLNAGSSRSFSDEINDVTIRKSMLENLGRQLDHLNLPYFLPKNKATLALPAVID